MVFVECSLKSRRSVGLFKLDSEQSRPVLPLRSHLAFKCCGYLYLRESKVLSLCFHGMERSKSSTLVCFYMEIFASV